ncbi:uncharacterized protein LOC121389833 [Gigantopelta aegis]|uniref:uncharacterized protein LOC121389833 n=1 Tax=Gigantopelta aegis TaxID=1735272 RepID=UPI001B88B44A|nr:uncharacterized protein LOC121389833 [Gigantopelta aegis]
MAGGSEQCVSSVSSPPQFDEETDGGFEAALAYKNTQKRAAVTEVSDHVTTVKMDGTEPRSRLPSFSASIRSSEIIRNMNPKTHKDKLLYWGVFFFCFAVGFCRREPLTVTGRRIQRIKILSVTLLPILILWGFAVGTFNDLLGGKEEVERVCFSESCGLYECFFFSSIFFQTQYTVKFSVEVGKLLNSIQRERDMSILYLSMLGPGTKTFLINEYQLTDKALDTLSDWPANSAMDSFFHTKESFRAFLDNHRQMLNPATIDIFVEMDFYNKLIEKFMHWMYGAIRESKKTSVWKILVSYQKIVTGMEQLGIERALGVIYYVKGGFPNNRLYEEYNNNVNTFKANYRSAVLYSKEIDPIFQKAIMSSGKNLTKIIEAFRYEIQHNLAVNSSISKTQWWFDNMTLYLDTILVIYTGCSSQQVVQLDLATFIDGQLQDIIESETKMLVVYGVVLVLVILMCPAVVYCVETMTSSIQQIAVHLVSTTKNLIRVSDSENNTASNNANNTASNRATKSLIRVSNSENNTASNSENNIAPSLVRVSNSENNSTRNLVREQQRFLNMLGYMVPVSVSRRLSHGGTDVEVQTFQCVTVLASEIFGLNRFLLSRPLSEVTELLNDLFVSIDKSLIANDIVKFEANNEHFIAASGFNFRRKDQSAGNVADFGLDLLQMMTTKRFLLSDNQRLHFRIAIHTGPCIEGVVVLFLPFRSVYWRRHCFISTFQVRVLEASLFYFYLSGPCIGGVVGSTRMRYGLYGNTISIVNELQEAGLPGKINISLSTYKILKKIGKYSVNDNVIGGDEQRTFWLLGHKNKDQEQSQVNPLEEIETPEGGQLSTNN